jgi:hypothetical protein
MRNKKNTDENEEQPFIHTVVDTGMKKKPYGL